MQQKYLERIIDKELNVALDTFGAVLIEGPKWCGKTMTAEKRAASKIYLQDIRMREQYIQAAKVAPDTLLKGDAPRLIDEWQTIPTLWDGVRFEVDQRMERGQFILTGSAVPSDNVVMHTGTGRIARLLMRPMSLFESMESNGQVTLSSIFNGEHIAGESTLTIEELAFALVRGGWPVAVLEDKEAALRHAREYVRAIVDYDVSRVDGIEKNPLRVQNIMHSLARNVSTMAKIGTIKKDMIGYDDVSEKTIRTYINALRRLFVIEDQPAWSPAIRSKIHTRTSPKWHFVDPSIAAASLQVSPQDLINDFSTFGLLFESLCIRDLRIYAQSMDGEIYHYHDGSDLEVDAIIRLYGGHWGAIEVKMGAEDEEKAADNLKKLKDKIDREKMGEPDFLMILTAGKFAYRRDDGVYVVPIGCLRD